MHSDECSNVGLKLALQHPQELWQSCQKGEQYTTHHGKAGRGTFSGCSDFSGSPHSPRGTQKPTLRIGKTLQKWKHTRWIKAGKQQIQTKQSPTTEYLCFLWRCTKARTVVPFLVISTNIQYSARHKEGNKRTAKS